MWTVLTVQGRKLKATMEGSFKEELKSKQNAITKKILWPLLFPQRSEAFLFYMLLSHVFKREDHEFNYPLKT